MKDVRVGWKLVHSEEVIVFQGPAANIVLFEGEYYRLRPQTAARIKKMRTQNNRPWTTLL